MYMIYRDKRLTTALGALVAVVERLSCVLQLPYNRWWGVWTDRKAFTRRM